MLESGYLHKFALDSRVVCIELFCQRVECLIYTFHGLVVGKKHTWRFELVPLWCNCTLHLLMRAPQCCHGWRCAFCLGGRSIGIISSLENINFTMPCSYTNFQIGSINLLVSHTSHNYIGGHFVFFFCRTMMLKLRFKWVVRMDNRQNWQHVWSVMASSLCRMLLELTTTADLCHKQAIYIGILLAIWDYFWKLVACCPT